MRDLTLQDIMAVLSRNKQDLRDLYGRANVFLDVDGVKNRVWAYVAFKSPDLMKIQVNGSLGVNVMTALAFGDSLEVYLPKIKSAVKGKIDGDIFLRFSGMDFGPDDPRLAFLGIVNLKQEDIANVIEFDLQDNRWLIVLDEGCKIRRVWIDKKGRVPLEESVYDLSGNLVFRRIMKNYKKTGGVLLPNQIEIFHRQNTARIEFIHRKVNRGVDDKSFQMKIPQGVTVERF